MLVFCKTAKEESYILHIFITQYSITKPRSIPVVENAVVSINIQGNIIEEQNRTTVCSSLD